MTEHYVEQQTTRRPKTWPIERDWLEYLVDGVVLRGRRVVPGMLGEHVTVTLLNGEVARGLCRGFLPINGDPEHRSPLFTIEDRPDIDTLRQRQLPPRKIYNIELAE
jgi:hypothetical protein